MYMYIYIYVYIHTHIHAETIFYATSALLRVSMYTRHLQGVLFFRFVKVTKIIKVIKLNKSNGLKCL